MSNLKKVLSVGLASTMVMGMVATSAAAATYDKFSDKDEIVNKDAVSMVTELGIIAGLPGGNYGPKQNIDRASFARLVCVALNGGKEPNLGNLKTSFTDTQNNWAEKYIAYCVQQGIIAGKGNNTFAPAANVTGSEAAKMLLVALGYNTTYEKIGGATWQVSTDVLANQAGLYKDLEGMNTSEPLTRDNAAQMIYNTLNATKVKYEMVPGISADGQVTMTTQRVNVTKLSGNSTVDVTMLEDAFNATKVEAVITGNEWATLSGGSSAAKDAGKTEIKVVEGSSLGHSGTYNLSTSADLLGKSVTMYVQYKDNGTLKDAKVLGSPILSAENKVVVATDGSTLAASGDDLLGDNDLTVDSKTKVLVNYGDVTPGTVSAANIDTAIAAKQGGAVTLIDNDDNGVVDFVLYNEYKAGAVTAYSTKDDGSIKVAGFDKYDDKADVVGFDDVKKGDFVLATEYGGRLYVEKPETVTGKMSAYSTSKKNVTVDGTNYKWSELPVSVASTDKEMTAIADYANKGALDNAATFYLDNHGYVLAVSDADETYGNYAVVLSKQAYNAGSDSSLGDVAKVKLLLSDGTVDIYEVATIDGVKPGATGYSTKENAVAQYDITPTT